MTDTLSMVRKGRMLSEASHEANKCCAQRTERTGWGRQTYKQAVQSREAGVVGTACAKAQGSR